VFSARHPDIHEGNIEEEITVTSSLNEISTDQLGNRVVPKGGGGCPHQLPIQLLASGQIFIDDVTAFPPFQIFSP
jgi:hypothetical protein